MNGQPVWLASISRIRPNWKTLYVPEWSESQRREAERQLRKMVEGVGNTSRERLFRMNVTLCLHRAATKDEVSDQQEWFMTCPGSGLAGGPVEVIFETEIGSESTRPCKTPRKRVIEPENPHGWIPIDCGSCEPCIARQRV